MGNNELKIFENSEFGKLNVLVIDGKEYFPATECAKILGYTSTGADSSWFLENRKKPKISPVVSAALPRS